MLRCLHRVILPRKIEQRHALVKKEAETKYGLANMIQSKPDLVENPQNAPFLRNFLVVFLELFHHLASPSWDWPTEQPASGSTEPFVWNVDLAAARVTNPPDHQRICLFWLKGLRLRGCGVGAFSGRCAATALGGLLSEQSINRIHLQKLVVCVPCRDSTSRIHFRHPFESRGPTFSSSLRFSLRFFLRRAISARRMARSSAVKCFLTWGSAH